MRPAPRTPPRLVAPLLAALAAALAAAWPGVAAGTPPGALPTPRTDAPRDTILFWAASSDGRAGTRVVTDLHLLGPEGTDPGLTRIRGVIRFDPALVAAQAVEPGSGGVRVEAETGPDAVRFVAEAASPGGGLPAGTLLSVTFEVLGSPGTLTPLLLEVVEARGPGGGPAPRPIRVADGEIRIH